MLISVEKIINYEFKDKGILKRALTHSSYVNERSSMRNNERLEFLGDAVLELAISSYLYHKCSSSTEGELTKLRAKIVCTESLSMVSHELNLGNYISMGKGEENTGGRNRKSILANTFEAVIGAIYLDGGYNEAEKFIIDKLSKNIDDAIEGNLIFDYKTKIQEYVQQDSGNELQYVVYSEEGPEHNKVFNVYLQLNGKVIGKGSGSSKKEAEQNAAYGGLVSLGEIK